MADILNSIIHSSDNAIGGLYNAMNIRRQKEQDTRNAMVQDRNFDEDIKAQTWERAQQMALGGAPDEEILGLFNSVSQQRGWAPADPGVIPQVRASAQGSVYGKSAQGGGIGQYNPRDYTPATWAKFVQTGDPSVLARYEPFRPTKIGGVDGMADVVTGQFIPGVMAGPDGTQTPIDLNMVAGNQGAIAGSIADARNASDTEIIPVQAPLLADSASQRVAAEESARTAAIPAEAEARRKEERIARQETALASLPAARLSAQDALKAAYDVRNHPGLEGGTGFDWARSKFPGTPEYGFATRVRKLRGGAFLQARKELKGGGTVTDYEGQRAEDALAAVEQAQSSEDFLSALDDYEGALIRGFQLLERQAGVESEPLKPSVNQKESVNWADM